MASTLFADILSDQRAAELLNQDYLLLAADRNALPNHPALYYAGDFGRTGAGASTSSVRKVPILGLQGFDLPATVAEGASIVPSRVTDQQFTISVARGGKAYQPSDEVRFSDSLGVYNTQAFAMDAMAAHSLRLTNAIAALVGGFSLNESTTGVDLTVAVFLAAITDLETGSNQSFAPGDAMCVLHTQQVGDLRASFSTATGTIQWTAVAQEQLALRGNGYRGQIFGVDVFSSGYAPSANAGADRAGGMFCRGGIAFATMSPYAEMADQVVIGSGGVGPSPVVPILFERDREALAGLTSYVSASWIGVTRGYDTSPHRMGVSIITDL